MDRSNGFEKLTAQFSTRTSHFHDTPHVPSKRFASGEGDSLVKDAGELEADNHVADGHEIGSALIMLTQFAHKDALNMMSAHVQSASVHHARRRQ